MAIDGLIVFILCNVKRALYQRCCCLCEKPINFCLGKIGIIDNESLTNGSSNKNKYKQESHEEQQAETDVATELKKLPRKKPINLFTDRENQSEAAHELPGPYGDAEIVLPDAQTEDTRNRLSLVSYQPTEM